MRDTNSFPWKGYPKKGYKPCHKCSGKLYYLRILSLHPPLRWKVNLPNHFSDFAQVSLRGILNTTTPHQKKKIRHWTIFFVVLRYSPYLRRPRFFSIWTVLKVNNPLSPPTFSDPLPVSLFVSETGGNTDLKQLKSSLICHASYYIKHHHNFNRLTVSSFQRPITCQCRRRGAWRRKLLQEKQTWMSGRRGRKNLVKFWEF